MEKVALFWFRRDLRLNDNTALFHALKHHPRVLPVFIFDWNILRQLRDKQDARIIFIQREVKKLKKELEARGSSLFLFHGTPAEAIRHLLSSFTVEAVYANEDYEPYARDRDEKIHKLLQPAGIRFELFKDQVIFSKNDVMKDDGTAYTVFTPYMKKWRSLLNDVHCRSYNPSAMGQHFLKTPPFPDNLLKDPGFLKKAVRFPPQGIDESLIRNYHLTRDYPALEGTTRLSLHLRFGTVSIRELVRAALRLNETFLNELIWREFYKMILWHHPRVENDAFKPAYDEIRWRNDEKEFQAWCEGNTGYPLVDAGMRELADTGFMHNRVRMITASFLVKHLLVDWRWGEAWFADKLLDFDLSANNGGWQWAASSGCDAVPWFRIFNPALQVKRFDPQHEYIKRWVPEGEKKRRQVIPLVDHAFARARAIEEYKRAILLYGKSGRRVARNGKKHS